MSNTEIDPESSSSSEPNSSSPEALPTRHSVIVAIGIIGTEADVKSFAEDFVVSAENLAHKVANRPDLCGRLTLLPADEGDLGDG